MGTLVKGSPSTSEESNPSPAPAEEPASAEAPAPVTSAPSPPAKQESDVKTTEPETPAAVPEPQEPPPTPIRLSSVAGYDGRVNDIVYCPPSVRSDHNKAVIYFGGDVQDLPETMEAHRENKNYAKWNLVNTSLILHTYFPEMHIIVVRPARMEFKTFSCYDNFVPGNNCGAPEHTPTHYALQHLERLLQATSQRVRTLTVQQLGVGRSPSPTPHSATPPEKTEQENGENPEPGPSKPTRWWQEDINLDKADLTLVGFSKGCVVLNQLLYEFHYLKTLTPDDDTMMKLVSRIHDMYWLDGGHAGGKNTWITSRSLLETLTRLNIGVHVHVTPYQVQDERRPWIRKEEKMFTELLRRLGAPVTRILHFENQPASLMTHFEVLSVFRQTQNQNNTGNSVSTPASSTT
ncbi:mitochondrial protein C2orf69 homolog isoform X2 [Neocloeon triangulifer]|uniref:mitochondrial protein C2orf69 homolog isoform X2 n=1 Tax=Neocloeon triangulifer TaxID=2078957 RepID=UPI00286F4ED9|nr:mitochondrial protein C2orf69 homolog isoform X2 [Neocloeon triangulifer]